MSKKIAKREKFIGNGPVRYRLDGPAENPTRATIGIDYSDAPVPKNYYVADFFYVVNLDPQILMVFGKLDQHNGTALRNKLEIYFPSLYFVRQFWESSRDFHKTLQKFIVENDYEASISGSPEIDVDKTQTIYSNNVFMVLSASECLVDFFYLSPRDVYFKTRKGKPLEIEALVRVIVPPTIMLGFLDACKSIFESIGHKFVEREDNNDAVE